MPGTIRQRRQQQKIRDVAEDDGEERLQQIYQHFGLDTVVGGRG